MSYFKAVKCAKFNFGWAPPQTLLRSLQRSTCHLADIRGPTSKGREESSEGGSGREIREGKE